MAGEGLDNGTVLRSVEPIGGGPDVLRGEWRWGVRRGTRRTQGAERSGVTLPLREVRVGLDHG